MSMLRQGYDLFPCGLFDCASRSGIAFNFPRDNYSYISSIFRFDTEFHLLKAAEMAHFSAVWQIAVFQSYTLHLGAGLNSKTLKNVGFPLCSHTSTLTRKSVLPLFAPQISSLNLVFDSSYLDRRISRKLSKNDFAVSETTALVDRENSYKKGFRINRARPEN